jgi:hypothetical protein
MTTCRILTSPGSSDHHGPAGNLEKLTPVFRQVKHNPLPDRELGRLAILDDGAVAVFRDTLLAARGESRESIGLDWAGGVWLVG